MKIKIATKEIKQLTFAERKKRRKEKNTKAERTSIPVVNCAICLMNVAAQRRLGKITSIGKCKEFTTNGIHGAINAIGECANSGCDNYQDIS